MQLESIFVCVQCVILFFGEYLCNLNSNRKNLNVKKIQSILLDRKKIYQTKATNAFN